MTFKTIKELEEIKAVYNGKEPPILINERIATLKDVLELIDEVFNSEDPNPEELKARIDGK